MALLTTGAIHAKAEEPTHALNILSEILEYIGDDLLDSKAGERLEMSTEASTTTVGESIKIKIPAPRIVAKDGSWIQMGDTTARVTPIGGKAFEFTLELPHSLTVSDINGQPDGQIHWRGSAMRGVWRADLEFFPVIHGNVHGIILTNQRQILEHNEGTIESISLDQELSELSPGLWSGSSAFEITNLEINPAGGGGHKFSLGRLSLIGKTNDFDLPAWLALIKALDTAPVILNQAKFLFNNQKIFRAAQIISDMHGGTNNFTFILSGLRFGSHNKRLFSLQEMILNMAYDNDNRPGEYSLALNLTALDEAEISIPPEFYPQLALLKLRLERFPLRQILTIPLRKTAPVAGALTGQFDSIMPKLLLPLIYANRTTIHFDNVTVRAAAASLTGHGKLMALENSFLGAVGEAQISVTGLDELILMAAQKTLSNVEAPELLALLTIAKGMGRPKINADGELSYLFDIMLPLDGNIAINAIPLNLLQDIGMTSLLRPRQS